MCVPMYIYLTSVISNSFINCAVCNLSKTFFKKEGEMLTRIGNEKYMLILCSLEISQVCAVILTISKYFLKV